MLRGAKLNSFACSLLHQTSSYNQLAFEYFICMFFFAVNISVGQVLMNVVGTKRLLSGDSVTVSSPARVVKLTRGDECWLA